MRNEMSRVRIWMWAGDGSLSQKGLCECILPNYIRTGLVKKWLAARPAACGCEVMANGVSGHGIELAGGPPGHLRP